MKDDNNLIEKDMQTENKSHYKIVIPLLMLLVFISIGYSYLSTSLKINGGLGIPKMSWDVHFDNLVEDSTNNVTPKTPTTLTANNTKIVFDVELSLPGDKYGFDVDIVNNGTIDAMLADYTVSGINESQADIISYNLTYSDGSSIEKNDLLKAGEKVTVHFNIDYGNKLLDDDQVFNMAIDFDYVQADDTAVARD